jgi:hypothetical protein
MWILNNIKPIGEEIALGICDYFGIKGVIPPPENILQARAALSDAQNLAERANALLIDLQALQKKAADLLK